MARAGIVVVVLITLAGQAGAQPTELGIAWQAPASCPDAAGIRARIEQRLGRSLDEVVVGISVEISREAGHFVAHVDLGTVTVANDIRTLTSTRCDELADAVAVIVARVAREAAATRHAPAPQDPQVADAEPQAEATRVVEPPTPVQVRLWSFGVRLSGVSGIGLIPEVGLGGELALTVRRRHVLAEIAETRWVASTETVDRGAPGHVDIGLDVTAVRVGWRPENLPLRGWLSTEVGSMSGTGVALANAQVGSGRWVAAGAGFGVAWQMNRWSRLVGTTEVLAAFDRIRFSLGDGMVVYTPSPLSARASCGLEIGWQ